MDDVTYRSRTRHRPGPMIRLIARLVARLAAPRRQPSDPPGLPAAEAEQMRQALHAPFDDPDPLHWLLCGGP